MASEYKLQSLLARRSYDLGPGAVVRKDGEGEVVGGGGVVLRPCIFWYDSNHIVHISKALQIYQPYIHASDALRAAVGPRGLARFRLRCVQLS